MKISGFKFRVIPYNHYSRGAKELSQELGGLRLKLSNSQYRPRSDHIIINWGSSKTHPNLINYQGPMTILNDPDKVRTVANKLLFFTDMQDKGVEGSLPFFWTNIEEIPDDAFPVLCRTILNGHSGQGIVISDKRENLVPADLYVKYIKKKDEYRVHLGVGSNGDASVFLVQRKGRRQDVENPNWQIRNHQNGFVYVRNGVSPPSRVVEVAQEVFLKTGLDFGAVDVIWNETIEKAYVLEVNTAPGLEGQTVKDYGSFFRTRFPS